MQMNSPFGFSAQPFLMWQQIALKSFEMAIASSQVIGLRTGRFALAGSTPNAADQRELVLMVQEKGLAAMESAQSMGSRMLALNQEFAALAFSRMLSASTAMMSIATARSTSDALARQSTLVRDTVKDSLDSASKLTGSPALLVQSALKPIHKRVKANVTRLGKTAKKR